MPPTVRLILADDQPIVREPLEHLLGATTEFRVLATGIADGWQAVEACAREHPDVLLLDLVMPGPESSDVVAAVRRASPRTRILVLSGYDDDARVDAMCAAGVAGYVVKNDPLEALAHAIRVVAAGGTWFSGVLLTRRHAFCLSEPAESQMSHPYLAPREVQVLRGLLTGETNESLAEKLDISSRTVTRVVRRLCDRLGLASRAELLAWAARHGLVEREERGAQSVGLQYRNAPADGDIALNKSGHRSV